MRIRLPLIALLIAVIALAAPYQRGARGGCYTVSKSGAKRYVDRSFCAAKAVVRPPNPRFFRGPRGGCYTLSANGGKRYVDRSLCQ